jgi:hypothetical protein
MKFESRNPNFETIPKSQIQMLEICRSNALFEIFGIRLFGFVSDFDIRIWNFRL